MNKEKRYKVSIETRDIKSSESFHIDGSEEFTMNGKTFKFKDVSKINIQDADGNGGWNAENLGISQFYSKGKKKI